MSAVVCFSGFADAVSPEGPISPVVPASVYCSDPIPSDMAANFRNYMTHLSQLSPDHDNTHTTLFDRRGGVTRLRPGNEPWLDNMNNAVEMCSSESENEDCEMPCQFPRNHGRHGHLNFNRQLEHSRNPRSDEHGCEVHGRSHGHSRRNPNFPYESFGTPRVAWGETPREAWSDVQDDHLYDSLNPYALFNLPKSSQRPKRKQKSHTCTCQSRAVDHHSRGAELRDETLFRDTQPVSRIVENHHISAAEEHGRNRHNHVPENVSPTPERSRGVAYDSTERYTGSRHLEQTPEPSTSSGIIGHTSLGQRMLGHSKSLPIFSSQESMDTNSETGESSDTDIDIVSVNHGSNPICVGCDSNGACSTGQTHTLCSAHGQNSVYNHSAQTQNARAHERSGVIRPKAIKLESGQKYPTFDSVASSAVNGDREQINTDRHSCNSVSRKTAKTCIRKTNEPELFPSSESRVLTMTSAEGTLESSEPNVIRENHTCVNGTQNSSSNKSLKDLHNTVIRERFFRNSDVSRNGEIEGERSIDLTVGDSDDNVNTSCDTHQNGNHSNENRRVVSPVIPEVHLPSASDDSDIEVVKIETNR